jgi:predicted methyltransferase
MRWTATALLMAALTAAVPAASQRGPHARLFPPELLGLLEGPDRDEWQQPDHIMDQLGIADGARVADVGAGGGWFTVRLSHRVGPNGVVFAQDVQPQMIDAIERRVQREGLKNIRTVLGTATDPRLPEGLQAVIMVDTYPQLPDPVALLRYVAAALAPNGRLGIVDFRPDGSGGPGPPLEDRVPPDPIIRAAREAGLVLVSDDDSLKYQYLLVFARSAS